MMMRRKNLVVHVGEKPLKKGIHPGFETQGRRHQKSRDCKKTA